MKRQIIIYVDMEGASGIFEHNRDAVIHGSPLWRKYGKKCITSDVLAVCQAANKCEIDEILIYDGHYAGDPENNITVDKNIAEIGMCAYSFFGIKYIANVGCIASMKEAKEISQKVTCIPVKDKKNKWEPDYSETFSIIEEYIIKNE